MRANATLTTLTLCASLTPHLVMAQAAPEHHVWQDKRSFDPMSHTAQAITGSIALSGNAHFATPGSKMNITFGSGSSSALTSVVTAWRKWDIGHSGKKTAEIFRIDHDPGKLEHGNTLCGKRPARFIVFYEDFFLSTPLLGIAVFDSKSAPLEINSDGLCGTFSFYSAEQ